MAGSALLRIRNIVKAEIDDLLGQMENPKKMVNQMLLDMKKAFDQAVGEVSRAIANEKIIERRQRQAEGEIKRLDEEAVAAVERKDDDAARRALDAKVSIETTVADLKRSHEEAQTVSDQLKKQLGELRTKLDSARNRRTTIAMRKPQAQQGSPSRAGLDRRPFDAFDRLCSDVDRDEIASEVYAELADLKTSDPDLDKIEREHKVKQELENLKRRTHKEG